MLTQIRLILQEQSDLDLHCLSKGLQKYFCRRRKQSTVALIGALRVNKCEFSVYTVTIFMK